MALVLCNFSVENAKSEFEVCRSRWDETVRPPMRLAYDKLLQLMNVNGGTMIHLTSNGHGWAQSLSLGP